MYLSFSNEVEEINELQKNTENGIYYFENPTRPLLLNREGFIGDLKKINFFVGSNNSGKSRFLRGLLKQDKTNLQILRVAKNFHKEFEELQKLFSILSSNRVDFIGHSGLRELMQKIHDKNNLFLSANKGVLYSNLISNYKSNIVFFEEVIPLQEQLNNLYSAIGSNDYSKHCYDANKFLSGITNFHESIKFSYDNQTKNFIYIPVLRSLTQNQALNMDSFEKVIKENYSIEKNIFTGLSFYSELHSKKNTEISERKKVKEFESFLSTIFFDKKDVEITSYNGKPLTILFSVDGVEFPIYNIGDGIQMIILLLFPIFTAEDKTWFFIEEPETHLHPGLQRIFIETLLNNEYLKSKNLRYFFTTHSNHFLDLSLQTDDISIFQFQKESQEKFNVKSVKPNKETLDLLGVNNSSVLMANSSIWVEGPTDRKYISRLLKLYCEYNQFQHLKEDIDFAFFEYGGNLIEHYLFDEDFEEIFTEKQVRDKINSFALANRIYLLADNDNAEGKKLERRENLVKLSEDERNFKYQNTNYREIENLLPLRVVKDFLVELVKVSDKDNVEKIDFQREDYISIGLGDFIVNLFETNNIKDFKKFKDESGTLKSSYKLKLCNMVVESEYSYDDLVLENNVLNELVENLYKFIKNQV